MIAPLPSNEAERLDALKSYEILDTGPEQAFDDITLLASQICKTDVATITFIDRGRRWFNLPDVSSRNYVTFRQRTLILNPWGNAIDSAEHCWCSRSPKRAGSPLWTFVGSFNL